MVIRQLTDSKLPLELLDLLVLDLYEIQKHLMLFFLWNVIHIMLNLSKVVFLELNDLSSVTLIHLDLSLAQVFVFIRILLILIRQILVFLL